MIFQFEHHRASMEGGTESSVDHLWVPAWVNQFLPDLENGQGGVFG